MGIVSLYTHTHTHTHLVVSVHHLEASAGLVLVHVAQGTLQTEDHVVRLLDHLTDTELTLVSHPAHLLIPGDLLIPGEVMLSQPGG